MSHTSRVSGYCVLPIILRGPGFFFVRFQWIFVWGWSDKSETLTTPSKLNSEFSPETDGWNLLEFRPIFRGGYLEDHPRTCKGINNHGDRKSPKWGYPPYKWPKWDDSPSMLNFESVKKKMNEGTATLPAGELRSLRVCECRLSNDTLRNQGTPLRCCSKTFSK